MREDETLTNRCLVTRRRNGKRKKIKLKREKEMKRSLTGNANGKTSRKKINMKIERKRSLTCVTKNIKKIKKLKGENIQKFRKQG